ncbi:hypothetical protein [Paracoccus marinaquae]|uniref:DdrB-like domain-containing protein n=1 Tax=Paracoccus marinaquae TaxID=2841926 RepID=A0ABS6AP16_9RHOB|nr:hypothetical protein [Paracoccus marinaquae]MBU3031360.1 hypothetical protein [Paracoccus marinaquae]
MGQSGADGWFSGLPTTADEFEAEVLRRRKNDFDENRAMLERGDSTVAQLLGEISATFAEPASLATLPLGGSIRNAGRFIATEAGLGVASDIPGVIAEQQVAGDLGFTPSDPLTELGVSAVAGAGFASVFVGAGRAVEYFRGRRRAEVEARPEGRPGMDWEDDVEAAEADLRSGREPAPMPDPALLGGNTGIDEGYFAAIRSAESGGNDAARNPRSSATGRYQFTSDTWAGLMRQHPALGLTADGRLDPQQQELAIRAFTQDNADALRAAGLPVNRGNLYAAHFLGAGDAPRVLRASPDAMLTDLLSPSVITANPFLRGMRVQDFRAWTMRKTGGPGGGTGPGEDFQPLPAGDQFSWAQSQSQPLPDFGQVTSPGGMSVDVRYRVADLSELRAATGELQPRDRSRSASDEQIAGIARNLDPRRLMPSPEGQTGTPIVGADGIVESGNGRVGALNRAAVEHPDRYQAYVRAIEDAGFEIPEGVARPVLIGERVTDLDFDGRRRWVRENNTSSTGRMSATEQAGLDADYLTQHAFDGYRSGRGLNSVENTDFVRRVFAAMPQAERAALMTDDGRLNIDGLRRLRQALFARAFDAGDLLKLLAETEHPAVENLLRMLEDLAPDWAAFRAMVEAGQVRPEFDITDQLMDVVRIIAKARTGNREGQSVIAALRDRLAQGDMFAARDRDMADALIGAFYRGNRARPPEATASILQRYIADAEAFGRADIEDLLGGDEALSPLSALRSAIEAQDARAPMPGQFATDAQEGAAESLIDIRALDRMETPDGAQSPALMRATDAARRDLAEQPEVGPFGPVLREFTDRPEDAIAKLMELKEGEVPDAVIHPLFDGPIGFVFGRTDQPAASGQMRSGYGLAHIAADHGANVLRELPAVMRNGVVYRDPKGQPKRYIVDGENPARVVVVRELWDNDRKNWVVTSFDDDIGDFADRSQWEAFRVTGLGEERAPSPTGPGEDIPSTADFQGDEVQQAIADARAALEADPGLTIRLDEGEGAQAYALDEVLASLDQDEALIARMTSCSLKGAPK